MARIPINVVTGKLQEDNLIVGIDLGTTNSLIAKMEDDQPKAIADFDKEAIVPSVIHFTGDTPAVGDTAKEYLIEDPANTIYSVKRLMGKSYKDVAGDQDYFSYKIIDDDTERLVKIAVGERYFTPIELSSVILGELKQRAEHRLKTAVQQAVITVPAYFNDAQRQATRDAGKLAGLDVLRILNEPTAAALAYGLDGAGNHDGKTVAVYDLGGGTFDVTLLRIENGIFEVLSTHGDTYLGGDDMDRAIVRHWMETCDLTEQDLAAERSLNQHLRLAAEEAKKHLTDNEEFSRIIRLSAREILYLTLDLNTFNGLIEDLIERTLGSCRQALQDAELTPSDVDEVVLVGGSTRVPQVKAKVEEFFGRTAHDELNPDEVVALGAAVQADILAGNRQDLLLLDVTPLSLGIETLGGLMDTLIARNSKVPCTAKRQYTTSVDGQVNLKIAVYQGEREEVAYNRKLAEFELRGIPAMPAGLPKIELTFLLNADGILRVEAEELRSGVRQDVEVRPQYGLTDEEVESMLMDSMQHAQEDIERRMQLEAIQEGQQMLYNARNFVQRYAEHFTGEEQEKTNELITQLEKAVDSEDKDAIQKAIDTLDETTKPMAERLINHSIRQAVSGKSISEAENLG